MPREKIIIGEQVNRWLQIISLFLVLNSAIVASRFDSLYAILGGAVLAVVGCFVNQSSVKWVKNTGVRKRWFDIFW